MKRRFLVFQHTPREKPGRYLVDFARKRRMRLEIVEVWHEPIPDIASYDGLIVLGGAPNVDQEKTYKFLKAEKEVICRAIKEDMPYLGFCLGHQLLAEALNAEVGPNFCNSVGFIQGQITKGGSRHPIFRDLPRSVTLFKWHSQAVLLPIPKGIDILMTSSDCQVEAISVQGRPHIVGFQFDNYAASPVEVTEWVEGDREWLSQIGADGAMIIKDAVEQEILIAAQFEVIMNNFIGSNLFS
jgi:GMP synthase-like glutamine amidotransferase